MKSAITGEQTDLSKPYAAFVFGQIPQNHPAIREVTMTPEYEKIFYEALEQRALEAEDIEDALMGDIYESEIVLAEEGQKMTTLQGGTVHREDIIMPILKPQEAAVKSNSLLEHTVKDKM